MTIKMKQFPIDHIVRVIESRIILKSPSLKIQNSLNALKAEIPVLLKDSIEQSRIISKTEIKVMIESKILNLSLINDLSPSPTNFIKNSIKKIVMKIILTISKNLEKPFEL